MGYKEVPREGTTTTSSATTYPAPPLNGSGHGSILGGSGSGSGSGNGSGSGSGSKVTFAFAGSETDQRMGFLAPSQGGLGGGGGFQGGIRRPSSTDLPLGMTSRGGGSGFLGAGGHPGGGPMGAPPLQSLFCASPSMPRSSLGTTTHRILITLHTQPLISLNTTLHTQPLISFYATLITTLNTTLNITLGTLANNP